MKSIGAQLYRVFTKNEYLRGSIPAPGTVASSVGPDGGSREYISVKLAGGQTLTNGLAFTIDGNGSAVLGTAAQSLLTGARIGILQLAVKAIDATATAVGTSFAWCQIYGKTFGAAVTVSTAGSALTLGADGKLTAAVAGSASAVADGITAITTQAAAGLLPVLLQYPKFQGTPA